VPHWYRDGGGLDAEAAGEAMFDVLAGGLGAAPATDGGAAT
jgi:hypothetical protein